MSELIKYEYSYYPESIAWDVTLTCNLRCKHCYSSSGLNPLADELTTEQAFELINQMTKMNVFNLVLLGGEPLFRKDIIDIIDYACKNKIHVAISTNGTLITPEIAKDFSKFKLHGVQVSIDSSKEEKHDGFRGQNGVFEKAMKAIELLSQYGNRVVVNTVISKLNVDELEDLIKLSINHGAHQFRCIKYLPSGRGIKEFNECALNKEENIRMQKLLKDLRDKYCDKIDVSIDESMSFLENSNMLFCTAGITTCAIKYNGDVTPCSYINDKEYICGNIKNDSLKKIWNNKKMRELRDVKKLKGKCKECEYKLKCIGGCKAASIGLYGDCFLPDPYCYL